MKNKFSGLTLISFIIVLLAFSSCKKSTEYVPEPYECNCGSINWLGSNFPLLNTSYILADSTVALSRKYYITGDIKTSGEEKNHSVNMVLEIQDVLFGSFFINGTNQDFTALVQEFNVNDEIPLLRQFEPVQGTVNVTPALFGGTEKVSFTMLLQELFEGSPAGDVIAFSGNFTIQIQQ